MAIGTTTVSGAYSVDDKAGIKAFIESTIPATKFSGAHVFVIPAANGLQCYIGCIEGAA